MTNTVIAWPDYVKAIASTGMVLIRNSNVDDWVVAHQWTLDEAEDLANHLLATVAEARRNSPEVRELTEEIRKISDTGMMIEDLAQHLIKLGYRKD